MLAGNFTVEESIQLAEQRITLLQLTGGTIEEITQAESRFNELLRQEISSLRMAGEFIEANRLEIELLNRAEQNREGSVRRLLELQRLITGELEGQGTSLRQITASEEWLLGIRRGGVPTAGMQPITKLGVPREGPQPWILESPQRMGLRGAKAYIGELIVRIQKDETAELSAGEKQWVENLFHWLQR